MAQRKGIHPVTLGVVGGLGVAAALVFSHKKTRDKIVHKFDDIREGVTARFQQNGNGKSMHMMPKATIKNYRKTVKKKLAK